MSVLSSMFLRAYRICSPTFLDAENNTLYKIFEELKYPKHVIDKAHSKARRNFYSLSNNGDFNNQRKRIICLPYASAFENFNHVMKDSDLKIVHKYPNTLGKMLIKNSPSHSENTGVYKIPCKDCNKLYFGETGRSFDVRLTEHRRDVQNCNVSNAAFIHKIDNDHRIDWNSAKLLFKSNNYFTRRIVESSLISYYPNFNISPGHFKFNKVLQTYILKATGLLGIT